jgi:peptidoglycan hydrolase-like protein with peptidoglycan-binding domain
VTDIFEWALIRKILGSLGYSVGSDEVIPNPETVSALREFQQKYGIAVTGEPSEETRRAFAEAMRANAEKERERRTD